MRAFSGSDSGSSSGAGSLFAGMGAAGEAAEDAPVVDFDAAGTVFASSSGFFFVRKYPVCVCVCERAGGEKVHEIDVPQPHL